MSSQSSSGISGASQGHPTPSVTSKFLHEGGTKESTGNLRFGSATTLSAPLGAPEHGVFNKQSLFDCKKSVWQPPRYSENPRFPKSNKSPHLEQTSVPNAKSLNGTPSGEALCLV
jgi:hypothetical protein